MKTKMMLSIPALILAILIAGTAQAAGDPAAGKQKAAACTSCHGVEGKGTSPETNISDLNVGEFKAALQAFKAGERKNPTMEMFAKQLSDQDIEDLAAFYVGK